MNIIIVGGGKAGLALADQLCAEKHAVTIMDNNEDQLGAAGSFDVQPILGSGSSYRALLDAGVQKADLLIAVTGQDETNLLSCLFARKAGCRQTIARVRNPDYYEEVGFIKEELGLSMVINPEFASAADIARLIQFPSATEIESFAKGRVNLVRFDIPTGSAVDGTMIANLSKTIGADVLVCIVERNNEITIPDGSMVLHSGDNVSLIVKLADAEKVFRGFGVPVRPMKNVLIAGGGKIAYYLAQLLQKTRVHMKILEVDKEICQQLSTWLPEVDVICGDATSKDLLREEGLQEADAFVALTSIDEENVLLALYAHKTSKAKVITKISRIAFEEVIDEMPVGSVVCPRDITTERILSFVRAMENSLGSNVETLYRLMNNRVEALEFVVRESPHIRRLLGIPLMELNLKKNLLICAINRGGTIITPTGRDSLQLGDTVVVVTTHTGLQDLVDILN
ncbi:MAG: Trk system potassium transporter TrkA [Clostridia bacterium]|nr:Trk system potassium transporter TrkA [Clostridia bacterium]